MTPATANLLDEELGAMVRCGFSPALALQTIATISQYINGFVLQEQARQQTAAEPTSAAFTDLPPVILAALQAGADTSSDATFEHGLRCIIDGTAAALARAIHHLA